MFGNIAINNCELVVMAHWALHVGYFGYKGSYNLFFFYSRLSFVTDFRALDNSLFNSL